MSGKKSMSRSQDKALKILILEDSPLDAELIRLQLKDEIAYVDEVIYDKVSFLKQLQLFSPDIILSDYSMPQFTGLEALELLKASDVNCPFIIITGAIDEETAVACIKAGADDYLIKDRLIRLPAAIKQSLQQHKIAIEKEETRKELEQTQIRLRDLLKRLEEVRDDEKKRISMEIHDQLGQELTANKLGLFYLKKQLNKKDDSQSNLSFIKDKIEELIDLSGSTINTARKIAHQLRPIILDDMGLIPAIEWLIKNYNEKSEIEWHLKSNIDTINLKKDFISTVFRIIQETTTNVIRHSNASTCFIEINKENDLLQICVLDNGIGFEPEKEKAKSKLGLFGIEERAKPWQGKLTIFSKKGEGSELHVDFPLNLIS